MKTTIKLLLPATMLLLTATFIPNSKPIGALANEELSSETTSVQEEQSEETSESKKTNPIEQVVIDGKTIEQWKKELMDENTRVTAIIGIVAFLLGSGLFLLKWLSERGLLKTNKKDIERVETLATSIGESAKEALAYSEKAGEIANRIEKKAGEIPEEVKQVLKNNSDKIEMLEKVLFTMIENDPALIASNTYKKAMEIKKEMEHGKEE